MDEIIVKVLEIHDFFAKGKSQTIDSWLFMKTPIPMFILFGAYLAFVYVIGPLYMRNRKAFSLNNVTRAYNLCQVAACTIVVTKYLQLGFSFENNLKCSHSDPEDMKLSFLGLWWFITVTRTIELIETAFFILRKKYNQASILHIYHHIGSIFGAWISLKYDANHRWAAHAVVNYSVHIMMYSYYFASSYESLKKSADLIKPYITIVQIVQLISISAHSFYFTFSPCGSYFFLGQALNTLLLTYLFIKFYIQTYKKKQD